MKLPFETWVREHSPTPEARVAFNEAVSTYKTGAYRAALVFSYVGMGLCLRLRLLSATCPTEFPQGRWSEIQRNLNDENKWDATVFDCTQMKAPKDVFFVEDDLRIQMKYWEGPEKRLCAFQEQRNRRTSRRGILDVPTVESRALGTQWE